MQTIHDTTESLFYPRLPTFLKLALMPPLLAVVVLSGVLVPFVLGDAWIRNEVPMVRSMLSGRGIEIMLIGVVTGILLFVLPQTILAALFAVMKRIRRHAGSCLGLTGFVCALHLLQWYWLANTGRSRTDFSDVLTGAGPLLLGYLAVYAATVWFSLPRKG